MESDKTLIREIIGDVEWDVNAHIVRAVRLRNTLARPHLLRERGEAGLLDALAPRCIDTDAPQLVASIRRFSHYATEALRHNPGTDIGRRYERAADRELAALATMPCTERI